MPFNAKDFRSHFARDGGFARNNHFEVIITTPPIVTDSKLIKTADKLSFRAHVVDMPSRTIETLDRRYAGPMRNIPIGHVYTSLQLQFIESSDRNTRAFFDAWQESITKVDDGWNVPYYKDLVADKIELRLFNKHSSKPAAIYVFHECFPITISASNLSWANQNQVIEVPVELAFHRWENKKVDPPKYRMFGKIIDEVAEDTSIFGRLKKIQKQYQSVVKKVNQVKSTVNYYKNLGKEVKTVVRQIKNFKPNFSNLNTTAESFSRLGNLGERAIGVANRDRFPSYQPLFRSPRQTVRLR